MGSVTPIGHQPGAEAKIEARVDEFALLGWSDDDLFGIGPYGYKGLAYSLRPGYDIGRIWEWVCEILCPRVPGRSRVWQVYSRRYPIAALYVLDGRHVYPAELGSEVQ